MIHTHITDPSTKRSASVTDGTERNALVVATRELKTYSNDVNYFVNTTYGIDMNKNGSFGGTPIGVHNGIDSALWTGSSISGVKVTFNSTDVAHTGSASVKFNNVALNDTVQFAKGSAQSLTGYSSITMWVYVSKNWGAGDSVTVYGWNTATGTQVGLAINIRNYFSWSTYGVWHKVSISLDTMGLTGQTIYAFRMQTTAQDGKTPVFYVDDFQIEETGIPIIYTISPKRNTWLHIDTMSFSLVDAFDGRLTDSTMVNLAYDKLLALTALGAGINFSQYKNGIVEASFVMQKLIDIVEFPNTRIKDVGTDGTNTWLTIETKYSNPVVLKHENDEKLTITINDDLTGLIRFRSYTGGKLEERKLDGSSAY